eukprot:3503881-Pyramimonas_sp.AAC.1
MMTPLPRLAPATGICGIIFKPFGPSYSGQPVTHVSHAPCQAGGASLTQAPQLRSACVCFA